MIKVYGVRLESSTIRQCAAFLSRWNLPAFLLVMMVGIWPAVALAQAVPTAANAAAPKNEARPSPAPDSRFKADILVVIAHPDDETLIAGYLAKAVYDEHKRVAVLLGTRGNSGGNEVGFEQAASLAAIREIEVRRALASMGIDNVWFMSGSDTPGQNVLRSLETWGHGAALEQAVRIIRLTRPEVILTILPHFVVGENHGDHQASAVIATEAFDMAGDPTAFPEQVSLPRDRTGFSNLTEGLRPWQPENLYFFSEATQIAFMEGQGPVYSMTAISPSLHTSYARSAALEDAYYLTQIGQGEVGKHALETGDFKDFETPLRFVFGKSLVGGSVTGDIFEGVVPGPIPFAPVRGYRPPVREGLSIELGDSWAFYSDFWPAHDIGRLAGLMKFPEIGVLSASGVELPLLLHNDTSEPEKISLSVELPDGWKASGGDSLYPVGPHDVYPVRVTLTPPAKPEGGWQQITWRAESKGRAVGSVTVQTMF